MYTHVQNLWLVCNMAYTQACILYWNYCFFMLSYYRNQPPVAPEDDAKYLVFHSKLMELFQRCPYCCSVAESFISRTEGTAIEVTQQCTSPSCSRVRIWDSQPYIGRMPAGNLLLSAAILLSGSLVAQILRMCHILKLQSISPRTFFRHQASYLEPTVIAFWKEHQTQLMDFLRLEEDGHLVLAGDARSDSPGHCAKFGSFTIIEQRLNKVLDIQLVQVSLGQKAIKML